MTPKCLEDVTSSPASQAAETHTSDNAFLLKMELISITPHDPNVLFKCGGEMIFLFI